MERRRNKSAQFNDIPGKMKLSCFNRSSSIHKETMDHDSSIKKVLQFFVAIETDIREPPFDSRLSSSDEYPLLCLSSATFLMLAEKELLETNSFEAPCNTKLLRSH